MSLQDCFKELLACIPEDLISKVCLITDERNTKKLLAEIRSYKEIDSKVLKEMKKTLVKDRGPRLVFDFVEEKSYYLENNEAQNHSKSEESELCS